MRLAWPPPWHLLASVLMPVIALALLHLPPQSLRSPLSIAALILVIFIPGYLVTVWAFPGKSDLTWSRRAGLCLVFSMILSGLFSLLLTATPRGLEIASIATVLSFLCLFLAGLAYIRWSDLPRNRRFFIVQRRGLRSGKSIAAAPQLFRPRQKQRRTATSRAAMAVIIFASCLVAALAVAFGPYHYLLEDTSDKEPFTEMEVSWPEDLVTASSVAAGEELMATVKIKNHENKEMSYTLRLMLGNSSILSRNLTIPSEESWQDQIAFKMPEASTMPKEEALYLRLYRDSDLALPYKQERILVNLSEGKIKSSMDGVSENNSGTINSSSVNSTQINSTNASFTSVESRADTAAVNSTEHLENKSAPIAFSISGGGGSASRSSTSSTKKAETQQATSKTSKDTGDIDDSQATEEMDEAKNNSANEDLTSNLNMDDRHIALLSLANQTSEDISSSKDAGIDAETSVSVAANNDNGKETIEEKNAKENAAKEEARDALEDNAVEDNAAEDNAAKDNNIGANNSINLADSDVVERETTKPKADSLTEELKNEKDNVGNAGNENDITPSDNKLKLADESESNVSNELNNFDSTSSEDEETINETEPEETGNHLPKIKFLKPDKSSPQVEGTAIFWTAEATDDERDRIVYKFLLNGREAKKWSKAGSWNWLTTGLEPGEYLITVLARDGNHASENSYDRIKNVSFTLIPPNQPPVLKELNSDRTSPSAVGGKITWIARAEDPDADAIYFKFMKNDKDVTDWQKSDSWVWDTSSETPGDYSISVLVRDGFHASLESSDGALESTFVLSKSDFTPRVTDLTSDKKSPQPQGSIITWNAKASDPDDDEISYRFLVDGEPAGDWSVSNSWSWDTSAANQGDHEIKVLARDGKHASKDSFDSFKAKTFSITKSNKPPILRALAPNATSPQPQGAVVVWKAEAQDPERDKIFYKFQLNGHDMNRWSESSTWKWNSNGQSAGEYKITVLARDGQHASEKSYDSSMDATFSLASEIDLQIAELMKGK